MKRPESKTENIWPDNIKLLLVEDNAVNQLVAKGILKKIGLDVDVASNGVEALNSLRSAYDDAPYTLILMDCQMPEMDGYEASRQIRSGFAGERYLDVPILAMTANTMPGDREKCLAAGMSDYLTKPIEVNLIKKKMSDCLKNKTSVDTGVQHKNKADSEFKITENKTDEALSHNSVEMKKTVEITERIGIDWDESIALNRMGGDVDLLVSLIQPFLSDMPIQIDALQSAFNKNDLDAARQVVHTIKGVSANFGALKLQNSAVTLENSIKSLLKESVKVNDVVEVDKSLYVSFSILKEAYEQVTQVLKQYQSEHRLESEQHQEFITNEQLKVILKALFLKVESGDYIEPHELDNLRFSSYDHSLQPLINQLLDQISAFDSNNAMQSINDILLNIKSASADEVSNG